MKKTNYDVIIIGGGIMGCAAAYYLAGGDATLNIAVVEKDPTYEKASTSLSMANVRVQFSMAENIRISQYAMEILDQFDETMAVDDVSPGIDFRREGNLFLVNGADETGARGVLDLQTKLGCDVEWWPKEKIKERFPLYEPGDMAGGTYGPGDGHLDAYSFLMGYRNKARRLGVTFIEDDVTGILRDGSGITGVETAAAGRLDTDVAVNCAGAWAAELSKTAGVHLPIQPIKRQVFVLDTAVKPESPLPLTVLPSGLYFRSETGGVILLGKSMPEDPVGFDFTWDEGRFMDQLWLELASFVPEFDRLRLQRGWAGLYAVNTFDGNAVLGEWPDSRGFYLANGFSGHGLQQAPAVGRYLSELILQKEPALDLSPFSPVRILDNKPLSENGLV